MYVCVHVCSIYTATIKKEISYSVINNGIRIYWNVYLEGKMALLFLFETFHCT